MMNKILLDSYLDRHLYCTSICTIHPFYSQIGFRETKFTVFMWNMRLPHKLP